MNTRETSINITDNDIATIEVLHDLLLETHGYNLDSITLKRARELTARMYQSFCVKDKKANTPKNDEEKVNSPKHYNNYPIEVIDMMVSIWGKEKIIDYCLVNAFKYRLRLGHKDDINQDLLKEQWYLKKAHELKTK